MGKSSYQYMANAKTPSLEELTVINHGQILKKLSDNRFVKVSQVGLPQIVSVPKKEFYGQNDPWRARGDACESEEILGKVEYESGIRPTAYVPGTVIEERGRVFIPVQYYTITESSN